MLRDEDGGRGDGPAAWHYDYCCNKLHDRLYKHRQSQYMTGSSNINEVFPRLYISVMLINEITSTCLGFAQSSSSLLLQLFIISVNKLSFRSLKRNKINGKLSYFSRFQMTFSVLLFNLTNCQKKILKRTNIQQHVPENSRKTEKT